VKPLLLFFVCFFGITGTNAFPPEYGSFLPQGKSPDDPSVFDTDSILHVVIYANFDSLLLNTQGIPVLFPALVQYAGNDGHVHEIQGQISTRGKFRRNPANCSFPSLRLYFNSDSITRKKSIFREDKNIKIVAHCRTEKNQFDQYVLGEYLIYKWYKAITPFSFKVRLVNFTYRNTGSSFSSISRLGFFLESPGSFKRRMHGNFMDLNEMDVSELNQEEYKRLCFFEFMISNNDWAASILHNVDIFSPGTDLPPVAVPFDFDFAGLLNIPYRVPSATDDTILKPFRDFKCFYTRRREIIHTVRFYNKKRNELYEILDRMPYLTSETRQYYREQLADFFTIINYLPERNYYILRKSRLLMRKTKVVQ